MSKAPENIDAYIAAFPRDVRERLQTIRQIICDQVPGAKETISYAIPTFGLQKSFIHFAGYKNHVAIYPAPIELAEFKQRLAPFASGKGTVQFPNNKPLPQDIIRDIVIHNAGLNPFK